MKISAREQSWNLSIFMLVIGLGIWQAQQLPAFGSYELRTILLGIIPLALLAMGQSIIIIGGGINLAIGAEAVLINILTAKYGEGVSFTKAL
jgi:ribose transport system permease protein